jgi:hypothetical protein
MKVKEVPRDGKIHLEYYMYNSIQNIDDLAQCVLSLSKNSFQVQSSFTADNDNMLALGIPVYMNQFFSCA